MKITGKEFLGNFMIKFSTMKPEIAVFMAMKKVHGFSKHFHGIFVKKIFVVPSRPCKITLIPLCLTCYWVVVQLIRFWNINSLQENDTLFVVLFFQQSFLSLQSGSNLRSDRIFYPSIKSYSPMDDVPRIRRQAKTKCEAATMVNVCCSLYDRIDV